MKEDKTGLIAVLLGIGGVMLAVFLILLVSTPLSPNLPPLAEEELNTSLYPLVLIPAILIGVVIGAYTVWRNEKNREKRLERRIKKYEGKHNED